MRMRKESGKTLRKIHGGVVYVSIHKHEIQIRSVEGIHCGCDELNTKRYAMYYGSILVPRTKKIEPVLDTRAMRMSLPGSIYSSALGFDERQKKNRDIHLARSNDMANDSGADGLLELRELHSEDSEVTKLRLANQCPRDFFFI